MKKKLSRWTAVFTVMLLCMGLCSGLPVSAAYENTHVNSGNPRVDIVEIAKTQIGYLEGSLEGTVKGNNNYTKYNVWNGRISGYGSDGYGYPWCHTFVSWCANQAGIGTDVIPRTAGTGTGRSFFVRQGTLSITAPALRRLMWESSPAATAARSTPSRATARIWSLREPSDCRMAISSGTACRIIRV